VSLHLLLGVNIILVRVVLIRNNDQVVRAERINLDLSEFAGRDLVLEEDIEIGICKTLVGILAKILEAMQQCKHTFGSGRRK
jgi:hypothetical protein